jgi:vacuolar-type H+-ATPase subunit H
MSYDIQENYRHPSDLLILSRLGNEDSSMTPQPDSAPHPLVALDQIRQIEAEVARQIQAAQNAANECVEQAERAAAQMKQEGVRTGQSQGEAEAQAIVAQAELEAEAIIRAADREASRLQERQADCFERLVQHALDCVIGMQQRQATHEPENVLSSDHRSQKRSEGDC